MRSILIFIATLVAGNFLFAETNEEGVRKPPQFTVIVNPDYTAGSAVQMPTNLTVIANPDYARNAGQALLKGMASDYQKNLNEIQGIVANMEPAPALDVLFSIWEPLLAREAESYLYLRHKALVELTVMMEPFLPDHPEFVDQLVTSLKTHVRYGKHIAPILNLIWPHIPAELLQRRWGDLTDLSWASLDSWMNGDVVYHVPKTARMAIDRALDISEDRGAAAFEILKAALRSSLSSPKVRDQEGLLATLVPELPEQKLPEILALTASRASHVYQSVTEFEKAVVERLKTMDRADILSALNNNGRVIFLLELAPLFDGDVNEKGFHELLIRRASNDITEAAQLIYGNRQSFFESKMIDVIEMLRRILTKVEFAKFIEDTAARHPVSNRAPIRLTEVLYRYALNIGVNDTKVGQQCWRLMTRIRKEKLNGHD